MLTTDDREMTGPGTRADGSSSFRRILVRVSAPGESCPALAVAARLCALAGGAAGRADAPMPAGPAPWRI